MKETNNLRVEKHVLKSTNSFFDMLIDFCHKSKNLYNHANYIIRQEFVSNDKWIKYNELDKILKADVKYNDYGEMPTAQSAQQILRLIDKNWKSFFKSIKDWSEHKEKYLGRPKLPKYLKKNANYLLILTNQNCKVKDGYIHFPKVFKGFIIKPKFLERENYESLQQVRIIPHRNNLTIELIYKIKTYNKKVDNNRYMGIDIGVNNLATVANNIGETAFIVNGRPLKSINQLYNKQVSHYREICKRMNNKDYSERMNRLTEKKEMLRSMIIYIKQVER